MSLADNNQQKPKRRWTQNPEAVRQDILQVAISEFAAHGLSGARVAEIAARTRTSKRMIYYYFGDKTGLYSRALEAAYAKVREGEAALQLDDLSPDAALRRLIEFTFDHHRENPDFIRMVMIENIHNAEHLAQSEVIRNLNVTAIRKLEDICRRGEEQGLLRPGLDPVVLHWQISAASFFNVSNRPTFSALFGNELYTERGQEDLRDKIVDMILEPLLC